MTPFPLRLRLFRALLLGGTALVAPLTAIAQPIAADARPQLDRIVAGGIIIRQDATQTNVTQSQQRGIVDWRRFDVGGDHHVRFQQPSSQAITLNRVTGPDPSVIAGRVSANGQVAIVNQSGVVFSRGAQVEAAGLIASTADISNENFMAGRMVFDRAGRPDARIENGGDITIREAGLAALVAPQVANHGSIRARLGRVALAGGETHVVDLHGDGLFAIEVTGAVRRAPGGGVALVTNSGVIEAQGGTVQLTAAAADGIVQDLVRGGGRIAADTDAATGRTGRVLLSGTGGAVRIDGQVSAVGATAGTRGGTIEAVADRVLVDRTARLNASGGAGGGEIAIGTTRRGSPAPRLARRTGVADGAEIRADATSRGNGGTVTLHSHDLTVHAGAISVQGGPKGGDGGFVEISGRGGLQVTGSVDVRAPAGTAGTLLIDPTDLFIIGSEDAPPAGATQVSDADLADFILGEAEGPAIAFVRTNQIDSFGSTVRLEASQDIFLNASPFDVANFNLQAGRDVFINASLSGNASIPGALDIRAGRNLDVAAAIGPFWDSVVLRAATGDVLVRASGSLDAGTADILAGRDINLSGSITVDTALALQAGRDILVNTPLVGGESASALALLAGRSIVVDARISDWNGLTLSAGSGDITIRNDGDVLLGSLRDENGIVMSAGNAILIGGPVSTPVTLDMQAGSGGIAQTAAIQAPILRLRSTGSVVLDDAENAVARLDTSSVGGDLTLRSLVFPSQSALELSGAITVGGTLALRPEAALQQLPGSVITAGALNALAGGDILLEGGNAIAQITGIFTPGTFSLRNLRDLLVTGPVESAATATVLMDVTGDLTISSSVVSSGEIRLRASGNLTVTPGGSLIAVFFPFITLEAGVDFAAASGSGAVDLALPGGLSLAGAVRAPGGVVVLGAGRGGIVQSGGAIEAGLLSVLSGGDALLISTANAVEAISAFQAAGNFAFDNGSTDLLVSGDESGAPSTAATIGLRTAGTLTLDNEVTLLAPGAGGRISLAAGQLVIAPGSAGAAELVEIAPFAAAPVSLPVTSPTGIGFELTAADLASFSAQTLRIGATSFGGTPVTTADGIRIVAALAFAGTLDLRSLADIGQLAGATLSASALTGAAGGTVALTNGANNVPVLGDFTAGGDFTLVTAGPLLIVPGGRAVAAGGGLRLLAPSGDLLVDGTVTGASTLLSAQDALTVNGSSAIARDGDLVLSAGVVTLNGLAAAGGNIRVAAGSLADLAGRAQTGNALLVSSPAVTFDGLDARNAEVRLSLGSAGTASGALDARALTVLGGGGVSLTGGIAGIAGAPAAAAGRRATAGGVPLGGAPPEADLFTFNGCPIGVLACSGVLVPLPPGETPVPPSEGGPPPFRLVPLPLAGNVDAVMAVLDPADSPPAQAGIEPPTPEISLRPARDRSEEEELAPPDIRGRDF